MSSFCGHLSPEIAPPRVSLAISVKEPRSDLLLKVALWNHVGKEVPQ